MPIRLFISHSSTDREVASKLIDLFRSALNLSSEFIRCTSVDGYKLPGGAKAQEQLRTEILEAEAFLGLISLNSIESAFVLIELGARWGTDKQQIPLIYRCEYSQLPGPFETLNALKADSMADLFQVVDQLAETLGINSEPPQVYQKYISEIVNLSQTHDPHSSEILPSKPTTPSITVEALQLQLTALTVGRLKYLESNAPFLPNNIHLDELNIILTLFTTESQRLLALELVQPHLAPINSDDEILLMSLFNTSDGNCTF